MKIRCSIFSFKARVNIKMWQILKKYEIISSYSQNSWEHRTSTENRRAGEERNQGSLAENALFLYSVTYSVTAFP